MLRNALLALSVACLGAAPCLAQPPADAAKAAIRDMLQKHDRALNEQNLAALMDTYVADPNIVLMGTGPGERWVGREEIEAAYREFFKDFDKGSQDTQCAWKTGDHSGTMAWLMAMCDVTDSRQNQKRAYALNLSAALEERNGKWGFRALHFSNLTGGQ